MGKAVGSDLRAGCVPPAPHACQEFPRLPSEKSGPRLPSVESGPRLSSVESGPRLPSEKSGQVAAAAMVAAARALAPAGALATPAIARARLCRACAIPAFTPYPPAVAKAPAAATIAAAATWPDFSDGNLGPDSTDDIGGGNKMRTGQKC